MLTVSLTPRALMPSVPYGYQTIEFQFRARTAIPIEQLDRHGWWKETGIGYSTFRPFPDNEMRGQIGLVQLARVTVLPGQHGWFSGTFNQQIKWTSRESRQIANVPPVKSDVAFAQ